MRSGRGGGVCPPPGCPIRESSDRRVPAAPRGVSPRGRALHRPCRPRHPPRAHPRSRPCRAVRTRARAGQEPAPLSSGPSRYRCSVDPVGYPPTEPDTPLSTCRETWHLNRGGEWWCAARRRVTRAPVAGRRPPVRPRRGPVRAAGRRGTGGGVRRGPNARALDLGWRGRALARSLERR